MEKEDTEVMDMKKIIGLILVVAVTITGCGTSDIEDYRSALLMTEEINQGEIELRLNVDIIFDDMDLTDEEKRDLSYYENIDVVLKSQYDYSGDHSKAVTDVYYNLGGLGFDMTLYGQNNVTLVSLPTLDKFIEINQTMIEQEGEAAVDDNQQHAVERVIDTWNGVLKDEDVISGRKDYVMTDKGQLKTTTYTININDEQFETLKEAMMVILKDEAILESFLSESSSYSGEAMDPDVVTEFLEAALVDIGLKSFEGQAFVDFDGRLAKQIITCDLVNEETTTGEIKSFHIEFEIKYDHLGETLDIEIPVVSEEDILELNEQDTIENYLPIT